MDGTTLVGTGELVDVEDAGTVEVVDDEVVLVEEVVLDVTLEVVDDEVVEDGVVDDVLTTVPAPAILT